MSLTLGVSGSETVQRRLVHYLLSGRVHSSLLFVGPDKQIKWDVAKKVAQFLFCREKTVTGLQCGNCSTCYRVDKDLYPDLLLFRDSEEDALKVEVIREITHHMEISPIEGRAKICIIDECHRMNTASANAFLKTLEEPKADRYFLLLSTQPGSLPPTLLSRCLQFIFKPESEAAPLSDEIREKFEKLYQDMLKTHNLSPLISEMSEKEDCYRFLHFLQWELRNALLHGKSHLFTELSPMELSEKFEATLTLESRLRSNANYGLMLESLLRNQFVRSL